VAGRAGTCVRRVLARLELSRVRMRLNRNGSGKRRWPAMAVRAGIAMCTEKTIVPADMVRGARDHLRDVIGRGKNDFAWRGRLGSDLWRGRKHPKNDSRDGEHDPHDGTVAGRGR